MPDYLTCLHNLVAAAPQRGAPTRPDLAALLSQWILCASQPQTVVELGTSNGNNYFSLCNTLQQSPGQASCYSFVTEASSTTSGKNASHISLVVEKNKDYAAFSSIAPAVTSEITTALADAAIDFLLVRATYDVEKLKEIEDFLAARLVSDSIVLVETALEAGEQGCHCPSTLLFPHRGNVATFEDKVRVRLMATPSDFYSKHLWLRPDSRENTLFRFTVGALLRQSQLDELACQVTQQQKHLDQAQKQLVAATELKSALARKEAQLFDICNSRSWKITEPLRKASKRVHSLTSRSRLLRSVLANSFLRRLSGRSVPRRQPIAPSGAISLTAVGTSQRSAASHIVDRNTRMIELEHVSGRLEQPCSVAVHVHVYYIDLAEEFCAHLGRIPQQFDLYITTTSQQDKQTCEQIFGKLANCASLNVFVTPNRGRDIAPFCSVFNTISRNYDIIGHFHTKKSLYNEGATGNWRHYLLTSLLGSKESLRKIFYLLHGPTNLGIVYPQMHHLVPHMANTWLANKSYGGHLLSRLAMPAMPDDYFDFPVGAMFWAKSAALQPIFDLQLTQDDFDEEQGQTDGTLAHAMERVIGVVASELGYEHGILRAPANPNKHRWGFDKLVAYQQHLASLLSESPVKVVAFDIFDTLLLRPLLHPEDIKHLIRMQIADSDLRHAFATLRAQAEAQARERLGTDVCLEEIYDELASLSRQDRERLRTVQDLEVACEMASVRPRFEAIELMQHCKKQGKRVILASDMFLPRQVITGMLNEHDIHFYDALYLSNEVGKRKDTAELYHHILQQEGISPQELLMVGDNERSDFQIPLDLGIRTLHVLRPVSQALGFPVMERMVRKAKSMDDLAYQTALGAVISRVFAPLEQPETGDYSFIPYDWRTIGFAILGPVLVSYCAWIRQQAEALGIDKFYFLSRDAKIILDVYKALYPDASQGPELEYLVLSRRAISIPAIKSFQDILEIARPSYACNSLELFLQERYGIALSQADKDELVQSGVWPQGKAFDIEIVNGNIDQVQPVLQHFKERILANAAQERSGLIKYLASVGLYDKHNPTVIDIGYSGTIQYFLQSFLEKPVGGLYLMTVKTKYKASFADSVFQGYLAQHIEDCDLFIQYSFFFEKLLSANEGQVSHYELDQNNTPVPVEKPLTAEELKANPLRQQVHEGLHAFIKHYFFIRKLYHDFTIPMEFARDVYLVLGEEMTHCRTSFSKEFLIDDHYCGQGLA